MIRIFCLILCVLLMYLKGLAASMLSSPSIFSVQTNYSMQQTYKTPKIGEISQSGSLASQLREIVNKSEVEIVFDNIELSILYENSGAITMRDVFAYEVLGVVLKLYDISYEVKTNGTVWISNSTPIHIESDVSFKDVIVPQIDSNSNTLGDTLWQLSQRTGINFVLDKVKMSTLAKNISLSMNKVSLLDILEAISKVSGINFVIKSDNSFIKVKDSGLQ